MPRFARRGLGTHDAVMAPGAKRLAHRTTGRRNGKSVHLPQQQFHDVESVLAALEFDSGVDVGRELGSFAANQRRLTQALAERPSMSDAWRARICDYARYLFSHNLPLHWPLHASQVPAPNFLLADEVTAIAQRSRRLSRASAGAHWMSVHKTLCQIITHLGLLASGPFSSDLVEKEAGRAREATQPLPPAVLHDTLRGIPEIAHRRLAARSLDWRDVLAAAYSSPDPRAHTAADAVGERMRALYDSRPVEPHLERRTWSMKLMPDVQRRAGLVDAANRRLEQALPLTSPHDVWCAACTEPEPPGSDAWANWGWNIGLSLIHI